MFYTMKQVCERTDLTYDTLKFYCNKGLVPNVKRDKNNRRVFSGRDIEWIKSLSCLKSCGFSIAEMQDYVELCKKGETSIPERQAMLNEKLSYLHDEIKKLQGSIDYIHWKQQFYRDVLTGKREYYSNLVLENEENKCYN